MIDLDVELFGQLTVDGLDDLTNGVKQLAERFGQLTLLIAAGGHRVTSAAWPSP
jgi:X-X-X-Leu-X-X-Gly heptad repeat protein